MGGCSSDFSLGHSQIYVDLTELWRHITGCKRVRYFGWDLVCWFNSPKPGIH